jgi:hypothetical protein
MFHVGSFRRLCNVPALLNFTFCNNCPEVLNTVDAVAGELSFHQPQGLQHCFMRSAGAAMGQTKFSARTAGYAVVAFSGATDAETCRRWSPTERFESYVSTLDRAYKGIRKSLIDCRYFGWPSDPWVLASYAFPKPGEINPIGPTLRAGIGPLHFAGERTCYAFIGYTEGTLQSGIAVAEKNATHYCALP